MNKEDSNSSDSHEADQIPRGQSISLPDTDKPIVSHNQRPFYKKTIETISHASETHMNLELSDEIQRVHSVKKTDLRLLTLSVEQQNHSDDLVGMDSVPLQHATSLEQHIVKKIQNQSKFEESYFQYEKNIKFMNPLNQSQLTLVVVSIVWQMAYPVLYILLSFDGKQCSFKQGEVLGMGSFMLQFFIFMCFTDFYAVFIRIQLYILMNQKLETKDNNERPSYQKNRDTFLDLLVYDQGYTKRETLKQKIFFAMPIMVLSLIYAYGLQYQVAQDVQILAIYLNHPSFNLPILIFVFLQFFFRKIIKFTIFVKMLCRIVYQSRKMELVNPEEIDMMLIQAEYINFSNILFERVTKVEEKYMNRILFKESMFFTVNLVTKLSIFQDQRFQAKCGQENNAELGWSILFNFVCFGRFLIYHRKRVSKNQKSGEIVMMAVEYIGQYVNQNQLCIVINNRNSDFILKNLANFIKLSKNSLKDADDDQGIADAKKLQTISIKFDSTLYHKISKEETIKILLQNSKIIQNYTKIQEIKIFETVFSNQDFFLIGQIINFIPQIRSVTLDNCLIMNDHLFNKKSAIVKNSFKNSIGFLGDLSFEKEIIGYLRNGLDGRTMHHHFTQKEGRIPHLDFIFNFASHLDYHHFGTHICGYYRQVILNKRRIYEEFASLLGQFQNISIQFRISPAKDQASQNITMQAILDGPDESAIEIEDPQNKNHNEDIQQVNNALKDKMARQSCYDNVDLQFMQKFSKERKNGHFFTLKKLQCMLSKQPNIYQHEFDLMSVPNLFEIIREFKIADYTKLSLHEQGTKMITESENALGSLEFDQFCYLFIKKIKESKFIKSLRFRISNRNLKKENYDLTYFSFDRKWTIFLLGTLMDISGFCILQNFTISSDIHQDKAPKANLAGQNRIMQDIRVQSILQDTCLSLKNMKQISITSILLHDLPMFMKSLINQNQNMDTIELVNCSNQLMLNKMFFDLLGESLKLLNLNLSDNNAQINGWQSFRQFMTLVFKNRRVNFSRNPLFINTFFRTDKQIHEAFDDMIDDRALSSSSTEDVVLESLNLQETFLGKDQANQYVFFEFVSGLVMNKVNRIREINLSYNHIYSIDQYTLNGQTFQLYEISYLPNFFTLVQNWSRISRLQIDLSFNKLKTVDFLTLLLSTDHLKLNLNLHGNNIDFTQFNKESLLQWKRVFQFDMFIKYIFNKITVRAFMANQMSQNEQFEKQFETKEKALQHLESYYHAQTESPEIPNEYLQILENIPSNLVPSKLKKGMVNFCKETLVKKYTEISLLQAPDQFLKKDEQQLHKFWNDTKQIKFDMNKIESLNIGFQRDVQQHNLITKCFDLMHILSCFISLSQLDSLMTQPEAKYCLKIYDYLNTLRKQNKILESQFKFNIKFSVEIFKNLRVLKIQDTNFANQDILKKIIKKIRVNKIGLRHIDFSKNCISSEICQQIGLMCTNLRTVKEIVLDSTNISLSGIVYIFIAFINENQEVKSDLDRQILNKSKNYDLRSIRTVESNTTDNDIFDIKKLNQLSLDLLSLKNNKLADKMIKRLKNKLYQGVSIKKLCLSDNDLGDKGCKYLHEYFENNNILEHLEMNNTGLTQIGALKLSGMFQSCSNLRSISIAGNEKMQKVVQIVEKRVNLIDELQEIKYI